MLDKVRGQLAPTTEDTGQGVHNNQKGKGLTCVWNGRTEDNDLNRDLTRYNRASVLSCPGLCSPRDLQ